jgi:GAF domain-containing protein
MDRGMHETRINQGFVAMTGALMEPYDVVDLLSTLLDTCIDVLDFTAGGILIADAVGELELIASTDEESAVVETLVIAAGAGPCIDSYTSGRLVGIADIRADAGRWPRFQTVALEQGFLSTLAVPMRLRGSVIGVMNLMGATPGVLAGADADVAQSLADIATLGILHERNFRKSSAITEQLHHALDTRILIEQAKGVLAQAQTITVGAAFTALRRYAHTHPSTLREIAGEVVAHRIAPAEIVTPTS